MENQQILPLTKVFTGGKGMEWMRKGQRSRRRGMKEKRDILSDLPECVLLHTMSFLGTKDAVRTCVLSKRWKDLWKGLTDLSFNRAQLHGVADFDKFVSQVLSSRDDSISLQSLEFYPPPWSEFKLLNRVVEYAVLHNVKQLTIHTKFSNQVESNNFIPSIFSCRSLTFLKLCIGYVGPTLVLPKSLHLPALKILHLIHATFTAAGDNDWAEPFSMCKMLNTLVMDSCYLHHDAKFLRITNSNLSTLTINNRSGLTDYKIVLSTPKLSSLNMIEYFCCHHLVSSTCNLSFLEEVSVGTSIVLLCYKVAPAIIGWLQMLANVKRMTLSSNILKLIQNDVSNQPPCFVRLESLNIKMDPNSKLSNEEINRIVEYLLQNSPTRVDLNVINCQKGYHFKDDAGCDLHHLR